MSDWWERQEGESDEQLAKRRAVRQSELGWREYDSMHDASGVGWLVDGVIPHNGDAEGSFVGQLWGPSGAGKTFVALDLALSVINLLPTWFGFDIDHKDWNAEHRPEVAYFNLEDGAGLGRRVAAWLKAHPGTTS